MHAGVAKKFSVSLLTFLLIVSLGFANQTEASSETESTNNEKDISFTTEVPNPLENQISAAEDSYFFEGTFNSTIYTNESVTVDGNFWFYVDLSSTHSRGYVKVTVQRKGLFGYNDVASYNFTPNFDNPGGSYDRTHLSNLKSGEYRLKITRSPSEYTTVDGGMGGY